ncbi:MAG: CRTAC1 family protein [Bryobacteraceae bacterium]|nr:CRTAC1 family protein [Bryobacteraceae bacterium]
MLFSRRQVLALLAQGIASRGVKPRPRGKPSGLPWNSTLTDIAAQAGLREPIVYGGLETKEYIIETAGPGIAFLDYDNDGWLDILLLSGSRVDNSAKDATNRLYKNNRDGTFTDVTRSAGLERSGWAYSVTIADYNNDGFEDIFITYWGRNVLYRNNGDGTFTDVTREAGLLTDDIRWGAGASFVDYDRDGHLDLFVSNYVDFAFDRVPRPGAKNTCNWKGVPVHCGPMGLPKCAHALYRNNGKGVFTDVSDAAGIAAAGKTYGMTVVAADFDNDGWPDIYVACDSTNSLMFMNNHDGTFREEGLERGSALSEDGMEQAGMGLGIGDFNLDGSLDIFKTHFADDTSVLYQNDGEGFFQDLTIRSGLAVETRFVGWGAGIVDLDNDGLPDLFAVTGNVYPELEAKIPSYRYRTPRTIYRNLGDGKFEQLIEQGGPGVTAEHASRGCAFGDFDNDGDIDVVIMNMNEPPSLLRNDVTGDNHWLKVKLVGVQSNRSAIGGRVTCHYGGRKQAQEVLAQSSFYSSSDKRLHFGLGGETSARLEVRWPLGRTDAFDNVEAGRLIVIREGEGIVAREKFGGKPVSPAG